MELSTHNQFHLAQGLVPGRAAVLLIVRATDQNRRDRKVLVPFKEIRNLFGVAAARAREAMPFSLYRRPVALSIGRATWQTLQAARALRTKAGIT